MGIRADELDDCDRTDEQPRAREELRKPVLRGKQDNDRGEEEGNPERTGDARDLAEFVLEDVLGRDAAAPHDRRERDGEQSDSRKEQCEARVDGRLVGVGVDVPSVEGDEGVLPVTRHTSDHSPARHIMFAGLGSNRGRAFDSTRLDSPRPDSRHEPPAGSTEMS